MIPNALNLEYLQQLELEQQATLSRWGGRAVMRSPAEINSLLIANL
jgi:hypothetical protein